MKLMRRCLVLALAALGLAGSGFAPSAQAAAGDPFVKACRTSVNSAALAGCVPNVRGLTGGAALSPDGRQLYVSMSASGAGTFTGIQQYNRDSAGALSQQGCLSGADFTGCTTVAGLSSAFDMRFSPDGRTLYVAASNTLWAFNRNTDTGALNQVGACFGATAGCTAIAAGNSAESVGVTNSHVYLRGSGALTVFTRDGTGALAQGACYTEAASGTCTDRVGLAGSAYKLEVSPDGQHLYVPFTSPGGISIWEITGDELDQELGTNGGCISSTGASGGTAGSCVNGADTLASAWVTEIDAAGATVYVGSISGLTVYGRDSGDGELVQRQCLSETALAGCTDVVGAADSFDLEVTPDGSDLINSSMGFFGGGIDGLAFFRRASNGTLTQRSGTAGCMSDGGTGGACQNVPALGGIGQRVEVAGNSRDFYPTGPEDGLVGHYERDFAPVCQGRGLGVGHNTPLAVGFQCSDANGDALTYSVTRTPASGLLGAIDQPGANVVYSPNSGFAGGDSFDYRASARGVDSNAARVDLSVAAAPPPPPPPPPPPAELSVVRTTTVFGSLTFPSYTVFTFLRAKRVPAGATITVTCKTKKKSQQRRCPKRKRFRNRATKTKKKLEVGKHLRKRRLPPGTKITILITAPKFRGKRVIYTVRDDLQPRRRVQCLNEAGTKTASCV